MLADKLQLNEITIEEFQVGLFIATKTIFVASMLVFGFQYAEFYAEEIKKQINWIDRFGLDIKNGRITGTLQHRASLYIWSGTYFFEELRKKQAQKAGYTHVKRVCKDCPDCNTEWESINSKSHIVDGILGRGYECEYVFKKVDPS